MTRSRRVLSSRGPRGLQVSQQVELKLWGVRGSTPTPQKENIGVGGNTACLEVIYGDEPPIIFDGGSGIRMLAVEGLRARRSFNGSKIFFTHFHWDHIQGLPFMPPIFDPNCELSFYSRVPAEDLARTLKGQTAQPYFPVGWPEVESKRHYRKIAKEGLSIGDLRITPFPLNHPGGAHGYRIETDNVKLVYASDHEHGVESCDRSLRENGKDADLLIYDAQYTSEEYNSRVGWGHGTWNEAVRFADANNVKKLLLFHHDPLHSDDFLAGIERQAQAEFANTALAKEGDSYCF